MWWFHKVRCSQSPRTPRGVGQTPCRTDASSVPTLLGRKARASVALPLRPWHPFSLHHRIYWRISDFLFTIVDKQRGCAGMLREPILVAESAANDEERARLGLFPGEMVYRVDRIRGRAEQRLVEDIRLPAALFPHLQNPVPSISDLADTYGIQLGEALERVCAVPASPSIAKALDVTQGTLLLTLDRVVHLRDGRPAKWLRITYSSGLENLARLIARL